MNGFLRASVALHALAFGGVLVRPMHWRRAVAAVACNQAALTLAGMMPRSRWLGPNLRRLPGDEAAVALSFDDGPDPEITPRVLDLLDQAGMRASFFCIGQRARAHPDLVAEIARRGHGVENHTEHHPYRFAALPPSGLKHEIMAAQEILTALSGRPPRYFRAPMGLRSPLLQGVLEQIGPELGGPELGGLKLASWTRRALDGISGDASAALHRLTYGLAAGDVLLMHDGNAARDAGGQAVVLSVLPALLDRLAASGLAGVSLP